MDRTVTFHHHAWEELTTLPPPILTEWLVALHIFQTYGAQHAGFIVTQLAPPLDMHPQWVAGHMQFCMLTLTDNDQNTSSFLAVRAVFDANLTLLAKGEISNDFIQLACTRHVELLKSACVYSNQLRVGQGTRSEAYTYVGEPTSNDVQILSGTSIKTLGEYYAHQPPELRLKCEEDIALQGQKIGAAPLLKNLRHEIDTSIANLFSLSPLRLKRYHSRIIFYLELLEKALAIRGLTWRWVIEKDGQEIISGTARDLLK